MLDSPTLITGSTGFSKVRSYSRPAAADRCRGLWFFGKNADVSARNRMLADDAAQPGAFTGAVTFGDYFAEFDSTGKGFSSGLVGGADPFTMIVIATYPVISGGDASGQYGGFYNSNSQTQATLSYAGAGNLNAGIDNATRANMAFNQGSNYAMLALTNDGAGGVLARGDGGAVTTKAYSYDPDTETYPFKVAGGGNNAATGTNPHLLRVFGAELFSAALSAAELAAEYQRWRRWMADAGVPIA